MNNCALLIPLDEDIYHVYSMQAPPRLWDSFLSLTCYK